MCGITGFLSNSLNQEDLSSMTSVLKHRGPDANACYFDDDQGIGLGHRRLAILDLSPESNQPFFSKCGRYVMVYNGEVYNYKEIAAKYGIKAKTSSDTEIIIESFAINGVKCIEDFNGMFSIAIWDKLDERLWLIRDRLGIKPLYYYKNPDLFIFASELKSILSFVDASPNLDIIATFLNLGYTPNKYTFYNDVLKIPAGNYASLTKLGKFELKQYWSAQEEALKPKLVFNNVEKGISALKGEVEKSVCSRMISDVPLGTFLSGGIDSSLVTAVAQSLSDKPIQTFSIGFKEQKFNEAQYAEKVAKHLGTNHHTYLLSTQDALDRVNQLLDIYDEPYADSSAIPTLLVSEVARKHVTVALSGDGGDELFLGYGMYQWAKRLQNPIIKAFRKPIGTLLYHSGDLKFQRASTLFQYENEKYIKSHIFSQEQYFFSRKEIGQLLRDKRLVQFKVKECYPNSKLNPEEQQALFDIQNYLCEDLLVKVDRASMQHALEVRVPLLDHNIVEFALNLPYKWKVRKGVRKYLLKEVLFQYVPKALFERPKWGFSIPLNEWLRKDLRYLIDDYLSKKVVEDVGLIKYPLVSKLKKAYFGGQTYLYNRIWVLILLHKWFKTTVN